MSRSQDYWSYFAEGARTAQSPLYGYLAERIGEDGALKTLAARARAGQPHANMLLGAVHFLLLRGQDHPLKAFYPTLGGTRTADDGEAFALFQDFVRRHEPQLAALIESRTTNTNEVGRSALLHPGFRTVAQEGGGPLALIELGPSAGLNMIWDQYGVRYVRDGQVVAGIADDAPLVIECELKGARLPPVGPAPAIAARVGLELNPHDLHDPDNQDWLCALVWPEHVSRLARLKAAMAVRLEQALEIVPGDALENLVATMAAMPRDAVVCVYHTVMLYQFSRVMKQSLEDVLTVASQRRSIFRLSFESAQDLRHLLTLRHYGGAAPTDRILAEGQPHGAWMQWLA